MRAAVIFIIGAVCVGWSILARGDARGFFALFGGCLMVAAVVSGFAS